MNMIIHATPHSAATPILNILLFLWLWPMPLAAQQNAPNVSGVVFVWIGGIVLMLLGVMIFWNRRLMQEVQRRTQIEAALRESERRYTLLAENISDVIWMLDTQGRVTYVSPSVERLRGFTAEEAMRQSLEEMLTPSSFTVVKEALHQFFARHAAGEHFTERRRLELEQLHKNGSTIWTEVTASALYDDAGVCLGLLGVSRDISERKQVEQAFKDSEERFRLLIQHSNDIIVIINADGSQRYVSPAAERITGFSPEELQQKKVFEIVHPDDLPKMMETFVLAQQHPHMLISLTYRHICKGGGYKYLEVVGQNLVDHPLIRGFIGNTRDVSEWKLAEMALHQERQRLFTVLDTLPAVIYLQTKDHRIPFANRRFKELFGEPERRPCYEILYGRQTPCQICHSFRVFETKQPEVLEWTSPAGQTYIVYIMLFPSPNGEEMALECWLDITAQKRVEAELVVAKEAADAGNRAKTEFLATMSHELRTPLNGILGYAQLLLLDPSLSEKQRAHIQVIEQSGTHLLQIINDILDLSNIETQRLTLELIDIPFLMFLEGIVETFSERARRKGLKFSFEFAADLPASIRMDETRLRQVLMDVLGNAVKFTEQGEVTFRVVRLAEASSPSHARLRFEVCDTGPGIPADQFDAIFTPFSQLARYSRTIEGTGLGLALSQRLVRMMGGELSVSSEPGRGSRFWFEVDAPKGQMNKPIPVAASQPATLSLVSSLPLPARDTLERLLDQAAIGDILALRDEVEQMAQNAKLKPFAMLLQQYAKTFQIDKIRTILTTYLQEGADS